MKKSSVRPPKPYLRFGKRHPDIMAAYEALGSACHQAGPLDTATRELVKLGIALGAGHENAARAHARLARAAGVKPAAIRHVALLTATSLGFSSMMRGLQWLDEELGSK
ncbi:MAG TPA: carboxymuconolactone decarboxylase family protein [Kiritimatiellia bacterium]|nr:carboxymuconolactone decarboxylase family protein [Kiritimatiellia bacterium]